MQNLDIGAYVQRGRQAMMERRFDDARVIYRQILEIDPAQPRAWLALSALAQNLGDFRESVRAVRSAVPAWKRSGSQQFIAELSMRLLVLGEYKEARDLIVSADWSDPLVLRYSMGLVQYLGLSEAHGEALDLADHAVARLASPPAQLHYARANALRYLGRMEESTEAYERCIALDSLHAEAHWSLANHARSPVPGVRIARIRKALAHTSPQAEESIYLHYALYKELEDAGELDAAWAALEAGARSKRARIRYDEAGHERGHGLLQRLCSDSFVGTRSEPMDTQDRRPLFIVGLPRSGTTLLERILGNHSDVTSAGELTDFPNELSWQANLFAGEPPASQLIEACARIDFNELGRGYRTRTAWRWQEGTRYLIDKLPNNIFNAGFIYKALPEAKIVCVRRNPMDSCFSTFRHLFSGNAYGFSYDQQEMAVQYKRFVRLTAYWESVMPDGLMVLDYEDLVASPEASVRKVLDFCGLEYESSMLDIERNDAPSATASSSQVREGLHGRNVDSWRRYETHLSTLKRLLES